MLIKCVTNSIDSFIAQRELYSVLKSRYNLPKGIVHLTPNKEYVVYAISLYDIYPGFFIADDVFSSYPVCYLSPFFELVDERCSKYWVLPERRMLY